MDKITVTINTVIGLVLFGIGWVLKRVFGQIDYAHRRIDDSERHQAETYIRKDEFDKHHEQILNCLRRLETKLDKLNGEHEKNDPH